MVFFLSLSPRGSVSANSTPPNRETGSPEVQKPATSLGYHPERAERMILASPGASSLGRPHGTATHLAALSPVSRAPSSPLATSPHQDPASAARTLTTASPPPTPQHTALHGRDTTAVRQALARSRWLIHLSPGSPQFTGRRGRRRGGGEEVNLATRCDKRHVQAGPSTRPLSPRCVRVLRYLQSHHHRHTLIV